MEAFEISVSSTKLGMPHANTGPIKEVNQFIGDIHGADEARINHGGTTSNIEVIFLCARHEDHMRMAVAANAHRSVLHAAAKNAIPLRYIPVYYDAAFEAVIPPAPEDVEAVLKKHREVKAVFITDPTYEGVYARIREIKEVCRRYGVLLIRDAAWDHLPNKMPEGVDIMVKSTHKMEGADQGGAILLWRNERVDTNLMNECYAACLSTSPSIKIWRSVENAYRMHTFAPEETIDAAYRLAEELVKEVENIRGIELLTLRYLQHNWGKCVESLDPWKIQIALSDYKCTGYEVNSDLQSCSRILSGIIPEKSGPRSLTFISTLRSARFCEIYCELRDTHMCNECSGVAGEVGIALRKVLSNKLRGPNPYKITPPFMHQHETVMGITDALYGKRERVPLDETVGRSCAEVLVPYPPGYPPIAPGQRIRKDVVAYLKKIKKLGGEVMAADINLEKIMVSKEV